ncbi:MAG: hypothetical protein B7Y80_06370 [Hyphomicrobium sp. 32-62-53]|nr:MAG: hypothetical protein B7Z29_05150 [Hyphomicrobium sp. 12-62-95]OYY00255.1 MAG: hypothetical protein B7Y80_06370 [Hyphomicrobium sp. 32-62-53]
MPVARAAILLISAVGLAGCETGSNLFAGGGADATAPLAAATPPPVAQRAKLAVAPIVGPPDATSRALQTQVASALERQRVAVAKQPTDPSEYTLRGYVVAAKEKASTKISYIWDITDPTGKRVNRITGEEVAAGAGADTWSTVSPAIIDQIANKTATQVAGWLPSQGPASAPAPAAAPLPAASLPVAAAPAPQAIPVAATAAVPAATPATATGSIGRGAVLTAVPNVTGAPGDGSIALTGAIQRELVRNGIPLTSTAGPNYRVEGKVSVGTIREGKQPITIDWHVKDPSGKQLGTVSQKNEVPQGSLDGAWGKTADAAAAAAAQGIIKLLPKTN